MQGCNISPTGEDSNELTHSAFDQLAALQQWQLSIVINQGSYQD